MAIGPGGFLDSLSLALFGVEGPMWFNNRWLALGCNIVSYVWKWMPFWTVIFLAGRTAIPPDLYEAAAIDGAGAWRVLFEVTLPLLRPTIVFLVVTSSIAYLRIFDYVYAMTNGQGGPLDATKPLVLKIFETAFTHFEMGYAATQTIVLFAILLPVSDVNTGMEVGRRIGVPLSGVGMPGHFLVRLAGDPHASELVTRATALPVTLQVRDAAGFERMVLGTVGPPTLPPA
jgi:multiple sugar transport system permease protein